MRPYFDDGSCVIYHGDCREVLADLRVSVGAIITDPPYAVPTVVAQGRQETRNLGDLTIIEAGLGIFLSAATERLSNNGRIFVFCDGTSYPIIFRLFYGRFTTALLVWDKGQIGMGREFRKSHELILHGWLTNTPVFTDGVGRADVLRVRPVPSEQREHAAQKPVDLIGQLLTVCSGIVLDPFMGSGTTLRAAKDCGRKAIGIEIEERYCEIAAKRLSQQVLPLGVA